jgi:hypothetical protein
VGTSTAPADGTSTMKLLPDVASFSSGVRVERPVGPDRDAAQGDAGRRLAYRVASVATNVTRDSRPPDMGRGTARDH